MAGLAAAAAWWLYPLPPRPLRPPSHPVAASFGAAHFSLLTVGDTGDRHAFPSLLEGQLAVARGLTAEDLRLPVDALLLLGDNFYPSGLREEELVERIRANLVWPYCRFVDLSAPRSPAVAGACTLAPGLRRPIPIHAILGNHDHDRPESPALQREAIPHYVANWRLADGLVEVRELAPGLSLVLVDSESVVEGLAVEPIRDALQDAAGPWRIVASHHPLARRTDAPETPRSRLLRRAVREAGVAVQLFLSGHHHSLQGIVTEAPPALHVIAGSGSTVKPIEREFAGRELALARTGFARVERFGSSRAAVLRVTLYTTPRYPIAFWRSPVPVGRWTVDREGHASPLATSGGG